MKIETWKTIQEFPDYEISNMGRVKSYRTKNPKILKPSPNHGGYFQVILSKKGGLYTRRIHQLVLVAFRGKPPIGMESHHVDGNRRNNQLNNLIYIPISENRSLGNSRNKNMHSKLIECDVLIIRGLENITQWRIAKIFNVDQSTVSDIRTKKTWK